MYSKTRLLILDEPTNNLSIKGARRVLEMVNSLKQAGISCIFVTHNLHHVYPITDRIVVLNRGVKVADLPKAETIIEEIERLIINA